MLSKEDLEEMKIARSLARKNNRDFTEEENRIDRKWLPLDMTGMLIEEVENLKRVLQAPVSQVAREHGKMKTALERIGENDLAYGRAFHIARQTLLEIEL